jgi:hypothetical protein
MATKGGGPLYRQWRRKALYSEADLLAWAESGLSQPAASTAEHDDNAKRAAGRTSSDQQEAA